MTARPILYDFFCSDLFAQHINRARHSAAKGRSFVPSGGRPASFNSSASPNAGRGAAPDLSPLAAPQLITGDE